MKIAMLRIPPALEKAGLGAQMLLQVHDELVLEVPKAELEKTARAGAGGHGVGLSARYPAVHRGPLGQQLG